MVVVGGVGKRAGATKKVVVSRGRGEPLPVTIRRATEADAAAFRLLRLQALSEHPESFGADHESEAALPLLHWERRLSDPNGAVFLADAGGELVGVSGIYRPDRVKLRHNGTIWGVYVRPERRREALASQLIQACIEWAAGEKLLHVRLAVVVTNSAAISCYSRCGFRIYGIEPDAIAWGEAFYDELLMERLVG